MGECYWHGTSTPCAWCAEERGVDRYTGQPLVLATCCGCGYRGPGGKHDSDIYHAPWCKNRPSARKP